MRKTYLPLSCSLAFWLAAALVCCAPLPSRADETDYITAAEYIDSSLAVTSTKQTTSMKLVVNAGANTSVCRGILQLPSALSAIPAADVVDAKVWLDLTYDTWTDASPRNAMLYPLTQSFVLGSATWSNSNGYDASNGVLWNPGSGISNGNNVNVMCSWDITSLWGNANLFGNGAILMYDQNEAQAPSGHDTMIFSNATSGAYQGYVEVVTTPEPASWALLLMGGGALVLFVCRRKLRPGSAR